MTEISRQDVSALISALDDPDGEVRTLALCALVRLPLSPDVIRELSDRMEQLFQMAPSGDTFETQTVGGFNYWELIDTAIYIPTIEVRSHLHELLHSGHAEVRRATARALTKARDPAAISELVSELENPDMKRRAEAAECLAFHDIRPVLDKIHEAYEKEMQGEKDFWMALFGLETRFWLALALARQGELEYIRQVFTELRSGSIDGKSFDHLPRYTGDPAPLKNKLRQLGPFPDDVKNFFLTFTKLGRYELIARIAEDLLYSNIRSEQIPTKEPVPAIPHVEEEEIELAQKALEQANNYLNEFISAHETKEFRWENIDREALSHLEPEPATELVSKIINYLVDDDWLKDIRGAFQQVMGNEIVTIAAEFRKPFRPDVPVLSDCYIKHFIKKDRYIDLLIQIAWLISRAELPHILSIVSPHLKAYDPNERIATAVLIEDVTRLRNWSYPPIFGGGPVIGDVPVPIIPEFFTKAKPPSLVEGIRVDTVVEGGKVVIPVFLEEFRRQQREKVVNTGFSLRNKADLELEDSWTLLSGQEYYFTLDVGERRKGSIEKTPSPLPPVKTGARLTVALFSFADGLITDSRADTGELEMLADGTARVIRQPLAKLGQLPNSKFLQTRLFFPIRTPAEPGDYRMRCNIYQGQVLLQSREIHARVTRGPVKMEGGEKTLRSILDYTLSRSLDPAFSAKINEHRLSLQTNANGDGTHSLHIYGAEDFKQDDIRFGPGELHGMINTARENLRQVSWGKKEEWKEGMSYRYEDRRRDLERLEKDLVLLARWGIQFYTKVRTKIKIAGGKEKLEDFERLMASPALLQIAMKESPSYILPAAMIYDYPLDPGLPRYSFCSRFEEDFASNQPLQDTECFQGRCPSRKEKDIICPSGFWGFRHALGMPMSVKDATDTPPSIPVIDKVRMAMAVATDLNYLHAHETALREKKPTMDVRYADNRDEVFKALKSAPHIVYFFCHGLTARGEEMPYLQVGPKTGPGFIYISNLADIIWEDPRPLVFINGCHTTAVDPLTAFNFIEPLVILSQCAGVIGTEITIFEGLATAFAEECLSRFLGGESIGMAIRNARLKLLCDGNPLALAYIPFAWAALRLEKKSLNPW